MNNNKERSDIKKRIVLIFAIITTAVQAKAEAIPLEKPEWMIDLTYIASVILAIIGFICAYTAKNPVISVQKVLKRYKWVICILLIFIAVIPPAIAYFESQRKPEIADITYVYGNLKYNLLGALAANGMLLLASSLDNVVSWEKDIISDIVSLVTPLSFGLVYGYQKTEQRANITDHDTSLLTNWNQNLNVLYLIIICHVVIISILMVISYSIYQTSYKKRKLLYNGSLLLLSLVMVFPYLCAFNPREYVRALFYVFIPVILVYGIFWLSMLRQTRSLFIKEVLFISVHMAIYLFIIFSRIQEALIFGIMVGAAVILVLLFSIYLANKIKRIRIEEAEYNIICICEGTEISASEVIQDLEAQTWYGGAKGCDCEKYSIFLYKKLGEVMQKKGLVEKEEADLDYEELKSRISEYKMKKTREEYGI